MWGSDPVICQIYSRHFPAKVACRTVALRHFQIVREIFFQIGGCGRRVPVRHQLAQHETRHEHAFAEVTLPTAHEPAAAAAFIDVTGVTGAVAEENSES